MKIDHPQADIDIQELPDGRRRLTVRSDQFKLSSLDRCIETRYPFDLIQKVLDTKGPQYLADEIRREEDPEYVKICLENELLAYLPPEHFRGKRILDFGCGSGASTVILARMFPRSEIVGIELNPRFIELARHRADHYQLQNIIFRCSPDSQHLPEGIGRFDFIILSAVFEHLLPDERGPLLQQLWALLYSNGILFLNQTPYRWFPFEGHTSRLFLINYLPDKMACGYARRCSKRVQKDETWPQLLRRGIRGSHPRQIKKLLCAADPRHRPGLLKPGQSSFRDPIDVWYAGYAVSIARKYPKAAPAQKILRIVAKILYTCTGIVFLPTFSAAVKKQLIESNGK